MKKKITLAFYSKQEKEKACIGSNTNTNLLALLLFFAQYGGSVDFYQPPRYAFLTSSLSISSLPVPVRTIFPVSRT